MTSVTSVPALMPTGAAGTLLVLTIVLAAAIGAVKGWRRAGAAAGAARRVAAAALPVLASAALYLVVAHPGIAPGGAASPLLAASTTDAPPDGARPLDEHLADGGRVAGASIAAPGLPAEAWRDLDGAGIRVDGTTPPSQTIMWVDWTRRITLGETLRVAGRTATTGPVQVVLVDPFGRVEIRGDVSPAQPTFALNLPLRAPGRYLARLELRSAAGEVLETNPLPVEVAAPVPLRMLLLASSPSFELRGLRRWAELAGAELLVRTRLSRDVERVDRINLAADAELTPTQADLLVLDTTAWAALPATERENLADAVGTGLGLLLLTEAAPGGDDAPLPPAVLPLPGTPDAAAAGRPLTLSIATDDHARLPPLISTAWRLAGDGASSPLLEDDAGQPLAAFEEYGLGRVAVVTVTGTHRWRTAGFDEAHGRFWRTLVRGTARAQRERSVVASTTLPVVDDRVRLCLRGGDAEALDAAALDVVRPDGMTVDRVALSRDPGGVPCGFYWPRTAGWHAVAADSESQQRHGWYVFSGEDWRGVQRTLAGDATRRVAVADTGRPVDPGRDGPALPPALLAVGFASLAGAGWLLERRRRD